ncbi:MAG TPA: phytoene/squalene synthase family protein [Pirellulales bacterium]
MLTTADSRFSPELTAPRVSSDVPASYRYCRDVARRSAKNFYLSFLLLPEEQRQAMSALYAFLRKTDDVADSAEPREVRRVAVAAWRAALDAAWTGEFRDPLLPALIDAVDRFGIPKQYLYDALDGVAMDLDERTYRTFDELSEYCHRVAGVVGLSCIHIWGFTSEAAFEAADRCGLALQLTNILRDVGEDFDAGRVYLPLEDLARFDYSLDDLRRKTADDRFRALMKFEIERAHALYAESAILRQHLVRSGRRTFDVLTGVYHELLRVIERRPEAVLHERLRVGKLKKIGLLLGAFFSRS